MHKYNPYTDEHSAKEQIDNIIDAIHSMQDALREWGGKIDGKRASADRRFVITEHQAGGIDELSDYKVYSIAGIEFKLYGNRCKHTALDLPDFDLYGYPLGDCETLRFEKYGDKVGYRCLLIVGAYIIERDGMTADEFLQDILGWEEITTTSKAA